jgi:hypothetical protein
MLISNFPGVGTLDRDADDPGACGRWSDPKPLMNTGVTGV